ncbi:MAG TPA: hypothetical protein VNJ70_09665 [Thermoanaerobaculia bacterium]|nr:hypothetical protein [Thermoanaerobaculia bacterium]
MNLPFRNWILTQRLDPTSLSLYEEAFLAYKVGAYRASLVFSYLALLRALAQRVMTAQKPQRIPQRLWDSLQARVRDENTWESATFDAVIRVQPDSVFLVDDDLRLQLKYWRSLRNAAAHARDALIDYPHVETLWLFIRSNLAKLVVNGGREGLLERFRRHFDQAYTAPGMDFSPLVAEIPEAIRPTDFQVFIREVLTVAGILENVTDRRPELGEDGERLVDSLLSLDNNLLTEAFLGELRSNEDLFLAALSYRPNLILFFSDERDLIRNLWYSSLPVVTDSMRGLFPIVSSLRILAVMLRNQLIPAEEQREALQHVLGRTRDESPHYTRYPEDLLAELEPFGFFEAVYHHAFCQPSVTWAASNFPLTLEYTDRYPVDRSVADTYCHLFPEETPEDSEYAVTALQEPEDASNLYYFFSQRPDLLNEILRIAHESGLPCEHFEKFMRPALSS